MDYMSYALYVATVMYMYLVFLGIREAEQMSCDELTKLINKRFFKREVLLTVVMYACAITVSEIFGKVSVVLFVIPTLIVSTTIYVWIKYRRCFLVGNKTTDK